MPVVTGSLPGTGQVGRVEVDPEGQVDDIQPKRGHAPVVWESTIRVKTPPSRDDHWFKFGIDPSKTFF